MRRATAILVRVAPYTLVSAGLIPLLLPFAWMLSISLGRPEDASASPYVWFRMPLQWHNYPDSLTAEPFVRYYLNSTVISVTITLAVLLTSSLTGFGLAKYRFRGQRALFLLTVMTMMVPFQTILIPLYLIVRTLGWVDTYTGLIVPFAVQGFGIFLMRQYILSIPDTLLDAARLDGASEWLLYRDFVMPLSKPALAALAVFTFLDAWNLFLWPLVVTSDPDHYTIQVGIADFFQRYSRSPELLMASSAIAMLPVVVLFLGLRRFLTEVVPRGRL